MGPGNGYGGIVCQIPLGTMGILSDQAPSQIPHTALIKAYDIDYGPGYIQKAPGSLRYNFTQLPSPIVGILDYWPDIVTQRKFAATQDGSIYRDIGDRTFTAATPIITGLGSLTPSCQFIVGGAEVALNPKKVFFFTNAVTLPKVLIGDAATFADIDAPAADWVSPNFPRFGIIHRNRLWAFMGNRYYASTTGSHENFTAVSALSGTIGPGDGGDVITAFIYKGKMIVWKEGDVVYYLNDSDTDSTNWYFAKLAEGFGVASVHAPAQVLDDLLVGNNTGSVTSWQAVQAFGDIKSGDIFRAAKVNKFFRSNTTFSGFPFMHAIYYPEKHIALFTGRTKSGTQNDAIIALDIQNPDVPRYSLWKKDSPACLSLYRDITNVKRPMYGSYDGYLYLMDREDRLVGGTAYTGEFQTPHMDFRHLDPNLTHLNKIFDFIGITFEEENTYGLSIDVYLDGRLTQTLSFRQSIRTDVLDNFALDTSRLSEEDDKVRWQPVKGSGKRISLRCYNSGSNQNFKVSQITIGFTVAAEDATRLTAT